MTTIRWFQVLEILDQMNRYPRGRPGECFESSEKLAARYPELRYVEGLRTLDVVDGSSVIEHAWNELPDGTVIDSTARVVDGLFDEPEYLVARSRFGYQEVP